MVVIASSKIRGCLFMSECFSSLLVFSLSSMHIWLPVLPLCQWHHFTSLSLNNSIHIFHMINTVCSPA